jgi:prepilin-type N-terminal cleavage/methylation domain-containing protein
MTLVKCTRRRGGFTLVETAITLVIVGVAIAALVVSIGASTRMNAEARDLTTATFLAQSMREWSSRVGLFDPDTDTTGDYDDLEDFQDQTFQPPRDGSGIELTDENFGNWKQTVDLEYVDANYLAGPAQGTPSGTTLGRFTVRVYRDDELMARLSWVVSLH